MSNAPLLARARFGQRVVARAAGVLVSRARAAVRVVPSRRPPVDCNAMFRRSTLAGLENEKRSLEAYDTYLFDVMNAHRLQGQIIFEYGTLLRSMPSWRGLRVLDVGTGRSTFARWMSSQGAEVVTFDLPDPAEQTAGRFEARIDRLVARRKGLVRSIAGSMHELPFLSSTFDLVTSLSVVEHLDTDLPGRTYVPYAEQRRRLSGVLAEMVRVTNPGGFVYLTSECCDYSRATTDNWRGSYYYLDGPKLSAAWPVGDVPHLFYEFFRSRGCPPVGGVQFSPESISDPDCWTFRGPWFSAFSVFARKERPTA